MYWMTRSLNHARWPETGQRRVCNAMAIEAKHRHNLPREGQP